MQYEELISMVKEVAGLGLSSFEYTEGEIHLSMNFPTPSQEVASPAAAAISPVSTAIPAMVSAAVPMVSAPVAAMSSAPMQTIVSAPVQQAPQTEPGQTHAAAQQASQTEMEEAAQTVCSPLVGTFYAAPSEDAEPFVRVGDRVHKGQVLGIVEAMKLMNEIESDCDGIVRRILVHNEAAVEYGQPMFVIGGE